jgi:PhnB protein
MAVTPHLVVGGAKKAIEFYKKAFGATDEMVMPAEDGERLMHAQLRIGDAVVMLCDDFPEYCGGQTKDPLKLGGSSITLHQYVPSADAAIAKAAEAGATVTMPAQDMFWGDRYGQVKDPFGHTWSFAHKLAK